MESETFYLGGFTHGFTSRPSLSANSLDPSIDEMTMQIHHGKHHKTYVDNLNKALEGHADLQNKTSRTCCADHKVPENFARPCAITAAGMPIIPCFGKSMAKGGGEPTGPLGDDIKKTFGDLAAFKGKIKEAALGPIRQRLGWLVYAAASSKSLAPPTGQPFHGGAVPRHGIDVWEHAYY